MVYNKLAIFSLLIIALTLTACGGGVSGENGSDPFGDNNPETTTTLKLGYFDQNNQFIEGVIGITSDGEGISDVSAGGSIGLSVVVVNQDNQRVQTATNATFTSACATAGKATLESSVSTVNGNANNTFIDQGCGGASGISDEVTASITNNGTTIRATANINIQADAIGALRFVSTSPASILLAGTGDISQTQSIVTFTVVNELGIALADQQVSFSLSSEIGGASLQETQAVSNEQGEVSVRVNAGTVPTIVRVNASVDSASGETIKTQSDAISVTTGLPNQYSFSLAKDLHNVEALNRDGEEVNFIARLSDTFGNPVPDNTVVNFTAEGGQIQPSCLTVDGVCRVVWTSANPRVGDGIVSILATAIGHETLFDSNGNNVFDQDDGDAISDASDAGKFVSHPTGTTGFVDMSEAWRDDNDNGEWDAGEIFLDYNNNQTFDSADGLFNGQQCTHPNLCGQGDAATTHVRQLSRIITSGSDAVIDVYLAEALVVTNSLLGDVDPIPAIAKEQDLEFTVLVADVNNNVLPANTNINVTSSAGDLEILTGTVVQNIFFKGPSKLDFVLTNNLAENDSAETARIRVIVTTPSGKESILEFNVQLN